jgi:hypothetical protein
MIAAGRAIPVPIPGLRPRFRIFSGRFETKGNRAESQVPWRVRLPAEDWRLDRARAQQPNSTFQVAGAIPGQRSNPLKKADAEKNSEYMIRIM